MISESEKGNLHTGYKQTVRALKEDKAVKVLLAGDCDENIKNTIKNLASEKNIPVVEVSSMKELGNICEIEVSASCAVAIKNQ